MTCCAELRRPVVITFQPETIAFYEYADVNIPYDDTVYFSSTAYEITGTQLWIALDLFVVAVKQALGLTLYVNNLSTYFKFIYPRIGGTATRHKINLVDPTQFIGQFNGGWTHNGSGALPNGTTGDFDTNCDGNAVFTNVNSLCFGIDSKTNVQEIGVDMFNIDGAKGEVFMRIRNASDLMYTTLGNTATSSTVVMTNSIGLFVMSRTVNTQYKVFKEGTLIATHVQTSNPPEMSLTNIIEASYASSIQFSSKRRTLFFGALGFSDTNVSDITIAWRAFETTLNR